jgi:7-cyano-7-deazaguanine reductase
MTGLADSPLGRAAKYPEGHDPGLLFSIEREPQRALLGFGGALPFVGVDLWTAYEVSWLDAAGKPEVSIASFAVPADSPRLVESKSVKLYLAGLNLARFAAASDVAATLARDLGNAVGNRDRSDADAARRKRSAAARRSRRRLHRCAADRARSLRTAARSALRHRSRAAARRSSPGSFDRCVRSRDSPTTPVVQIDYRGPRIDHAGLLRYLVSFRRHPGFHEHCVERIFADVWRRCQPEALSGVRPFHDGVEAGHQSLSQLRRRQSADARAHGEAMTLSGRMGRWPQRLPTVPTLTFALSKGRIFDETLPLLRAAGIVPAEDPESSRKLIVGTNRPDVSVVIVRASDVPTYVAHGAADIGVAGKDVLLEQGGEGPLPAARPRNRPLPDGGGDEARVRLGGHRAARRAHPRGDQVRQDRPRALSPPRACTSI